MLKEQNKILENTIFEHCRTYLEINVLTNNLHNIIFYLILSK